MDLKDRVCVITGATGGLGRFVTRTIAGQGASLALISTSTQKLQQLADSLSSLTPPAWYGAFNLADQAAATQAAQAVVDTFGRIDILIHTVGGWVGGLPLVDVPPTDLSLMLDQHLWTAFHTARAFIPHMQAAGWGRFITISSPQAVNPVARSAPYAVAKAALEALTLSLAQDLKGTGVTANIVQVGTIDLDQKRDLTPGSKTAGWSSPAEITAAILYLCSPEGSRLNGARIPVYG